MQVKMNYGKDGLVIDFPDSWDLSVIEKPTMPDSG